MVKSSQKQGGIMERRKARQLPIIWEYIPSPISIPEEARKRLADLLGELLSEYWKGCRRKSDNLLKGIEHDK
jgi:hypothetical protein